MKKFTYPLSDSDIVTLTNALTVMMNTLPDSDLAPQDVIDNSIYYGEQAFYTLSTHNPQISRNQISALFVALQIADGIISGEVPADEESKKICQNSLFSIRKLLSVFEDYFES